MSPTNETLEMIRMARSTLEVTGYEQLDCTTIAKLEKLFGKKFVDNFIKGARARGMILTDSVNSQQQYDDHTMLIYTLDRQSNKHSSVSKLLRTQCVIVIDCLDNDVVNKKICAWSYDGHSWTVELGTTNDLDMDVMI